MDLDAASMQRHLDLIEELGWDSDPGHALLLKVRTSIARPAVRRAGLRGPAAAQAEASAWAAAWDALRRPGARTARNPAGLAGVAARRAVAREAAEVFPLPPTSEEVGSLLAGAAGQVDARLPPVCSALPSRTRPDPLGLTVEAITDALVGVGWCRDVVEEAIRLLAESAEHRTGRPAVAWRPVAQRLALAHWQVRRLAALLVGSFPAMGLLPLVATHGTAILDEHEIQLALRSTTRRSAPGPGTALSRWQTRCGDAPPSPAMADRSAVRCG